MKSFKLMLSDAEGMTLQAEFVHSSPKTEEDFKNDLSLLYRKYGVEYLEEIKNTEGWVMPISWTEYILDHIGELGYEPYMSIDVYLDDCIILSRHYENGSFAKMIGEELFNRGCEINDEVDKRMTEEMNLRKDE